MPMLVPIRRKGQPMQLETYRVSVYAERSNVGTLEKFCAALRASFTAHHTAELARPGPLPFTGPIRIAKPVAPRSTLHRHSKRCLVRTTSTRIDATDTIRPGWWWCKKIGYPGLPLHEHRTPRGRVFLVSHINTIEHVCPFDRPER
jgi:hypothetical protein